MGRTVNSSNIIQDWQERTENCYTYILTGSAQNLECIRITLRIYWTTDYWALSPWLLSKDGWEPESLYF